MTIYLIVSGIIAWFLVTPQSFFGILGFLLLWLLMLLIFTIREENRERRRNVEVHLVRELAKNEMDIHSKYIDEVNTRNAYFERQKSEAEILNKSNISDSTFTRIPDGRILNKTALLNLLKILNDSGFEETKETVLFQFETQKRDNISEQEQAIVVLTSTILSTFTTNKMDKSYILKVLLDDKDLFSSFYLLYFWIFVEQEGRYEEDEFKDVCKDFQNFIQNE